MSESASNPQNQPPRITDPRSVQTVALVGSYVPRQCGIATFTKDLRDAIATELGQGQATVLAMDDIPESYNYPNEVRFQIPEQKQADYRTASELLNINQIDVAVIQHEYGIFGGKDGSYLMELLKRLRMPIITTLHTVLRDPSAGQRAVMRDLSRLSDKLIVMSHACVDILHEVYNVPDDRIEMIPHGIPDVPFSDSSFFKDQFGLEGRSVMLTFGLLGPGKGIELVLKALPRIVENHPNVVYVILGATHPNILRNEGNAYRDSLERLVDRLGVRENVAFHNRYVTIDELVRYIGTADIYVTPYPNPAQVVSGTLAYTVGAGKAVVSTPYVYAREVLADGRGRLFDFNDADQLADAVVELLDDPVKRDAMRKRAYLYGRPMVWKEVARRYLEVARQVAGERKRSPRPVAAFKSDEDHTPALPELSLAHLRRMTDDTGMLQHAIYAIPDRHHGYCTDDNSRALVTALLCYELTKDKSVQPLTDTYLSFLHHAFNRENKRFRNFMSFDRQWLEEVGSDDVHGRAVWSLGIAVALAPNKSVLSFATRLFNEALLRAEELTYPRSWAFSLVGIHAYLQRFGGDTRARRVRTVLAQRLFDRFRANASEDWPWCEDVVTYDNAKLPHALILAGQWIPDNAMLEQGLKSLDWLLRLQLLPDKTVSLIGNQGWIKRNGERARFDQQPIEAMAIIEACAEAYRSTQDRLWIERAHQTLGFFTGANDTHSVLYDYHTGGCCDGLHADGPNHNQGAESTLAWLISLLTVMWLDRAVGLEDAEAVKTLTGERASDESPGGEVEAALT
ncbi:MAG: glycosyltransferase [Phycisphaera sp.]|nr:glycosyltransferase [Phycisphaera sp.]